MNKQRKVVITITYNEMGIIIDTKAEEVAQTNLQPTCNNLATDTISRQAAIDLIDGIETERLKGTVELIYAPAIKGLRALPSAQPARDIPKKPNETTDKAWGIPHRQAVCPNCDSYLGTIHFICEGDKRKVTFCESCGQAIDWEGWKEND